jgi:hypothetical protein
MLRPTHNLVWMRLPIALIAVALGAAAAPAALADTVTSSNWAGYAVHRTGVGFKKVSAAWTQPRATCTSGRQTYSAIWVGLGGYNESSNALEQIGSEVDCTASGRVASSVWYELVPAASQNIKMRVRPGDALYATVTVNGNTVLLSIKDTTTHKSFKKTLHASEVDITSAEWIVEAPSDCISANTCQTLPLADFGSATFAFATAQSVAGHVGTISDPAWSSSKIRLTASGRRFVSYNGSSALVGVANPSPVASRGSSFKVTYSTVTAQSGPFLTQRASSARAGHLVHPRRY